MSSRELFLRFGKIEISTHADGGGLVKVGDGAIEIAPGDWFLFVDIVRAVALVTEAVERAG